MSASAELFQSNEGGRGGLRATAARRVGVVVNAGGVIGFDRQLWRAMLSLLLRDLPRFHGSSSSYYPSLGSRSWGSLLGRPGDGRERFADVDESGADVAYAVEAC